MITFRLSWWWIVVVDCRSSSTIRYLVRPGLWATLNWILNGRNVNNIFIPRPSVLVIWASKWRKSSLFGVVLLATAQLLNIAQASQLTSCNSAPNWLRQWWCCWLAKLLTTNHYMLSVNKQSGTDLRRLQESGNENVLLHWLFLIRLSSNVHLREEYVLYLCFVSWVVSHRYMCIG